MIPKPVGDQFLGINETRDADAAKAKAAAIASGLRPPPQRSSSHNMVDFYVLGLEGDEDTQRRYDGDSGGDGAAKPVVPGDSGGTPAAG